MSLVEVTKVIDIKHVTRNHFKLINIITVFAMTPNIIADMTETQRHKIKKMVKSEVLNEIITRSHFNEASLYTTVSAEETNTETAYTPERETNEYLKSSVASDVSTKYDKSTKTTSTEDEATTTDMEFSTILQKEVSTQLIEFVSTDDTSEEMQQSYTTSEITQEEMNTTEVRRYFTSQYDKSITASANDVTSAIDMEFSTVFQNMVSTESIQAQHTIEATTDEIQHTTGTDETLTIDIQHTSIAEATIGDIQHTTFADEPTTGDIQHTTPTNEIITIEIKHSSSDEPASDQMHYTTFTDELTTGEKQRTTSTDESTTTTNEQHISTTDKSTTEEIQHTTTVNDITTGNIQYISTTDEPTTGEIRYTTLRDEATTGKIQHTTPADEIITIEMQHTTSRDEHTTRDIQHTTSTDEPTTTNKQHTSITDESTTEEIQHTTLPDEATTKVKQHISTTTETTTGDIQHTSTPVDLSCSNVGNRSAIYVLEDIIFPPIGNEERSQNLQAWFSRSHQNKYDVCFLKVLLNVQSEDTTVNIASESRIHTSPCGTVFECVDHQDEAVCMLIKHPGLVTDGAMISEMTETLIDVYATKYQGGQCTVDQINPLFNATYGDHVINASGSTFSLSLKDLPYGADFGIYCSKGVRNKELAKDRSLNMCMSGTNDDEQISKDISLDNWAVRYTC